jgi:hypothetical protein
MNLTITEAIITNLRADTTLTGWLGGTTHIFRARKIAPADLPCVTLLVNNEASRGRVGYDHSKHRDSSPLIQLDVWVSATQGDFPQSDDDTDIIAARVDKDILLPESPLTAITGTSCWNRVTESSPQFEDDTEIWHDALRYAFNYTLQD